MKSAIKPNVSSPSGSGGLASYAAAGLIGLGVGLLWPWQAALALQKQELLEAISSPAPRTFPKATKRQGQLLAQRPRTTKPIGGQVQADQALADQANSILSSQIQPHPSSASKLAEQQDSVLTIRNQRYLLALVQCDFGAANEAAVMKLYARQAPGRQSAELWINHDGAQHYQLLFASDKPRISYQAQQINLEFVDGWLRWHGLVEGRDGPLPMQLRLRCGEAPRIRTSLSGPTDMAGFDKAIR